MAVDRLSIYNNALGILGARALTSEYENRPNRKSLDEFWALNIVNHCLEMAKPKFAMTVAKLDTPVVSTAHSLDSVYTLPADYVCLLAVYSDEALQIKVERYLLGNGTIATEVGTNIYVRYISSAVGFDKWTPGFSRMVPAYLASQAANRIAPNKHETALKNFTDLLNVTLEVEGFKEVEPRPLKTIFTADADYLRIYNGVAQLLGKPLLVSNSDQSAMRIALDYAIGAADANDNTNALSYALVKARPRFAMVTAALAAGVASVVHGFTQVHTLPANYVAIEALYAEANMDEPVNRYFIDGRTIATNFATVYLRYLAADPVTTNWTPGFLRYFCAHLALEICGEHMGGETATERAENRRALKMIHDERLQFVQENEAYSEPEKRPGIPEFTLTDTVVGIYNTALAILKLPPILSINDDSERRHFLDVQMNSGLIKRLMSVIVWNFACVRETLAYDATYTAELGWAYRFLIPVTVHRLDKLYTDQEFYSEADYLREGLYYFANVPTLYARYATTAMLTTPDSWPQYFRDYVSAELAVLASGLPGADKAEAFRRQPKYFREATNTDAEWNSPKPQRAGTWVSARRHGWGSRMRIEGGRGSFH